MGGTATNGRNGNRLLRALRMAHPGSFKGRTPSGLDRTVTVGRSSAIELGMLPRRKISLLVVGALTVGASASTAACAHHDCHRLEDPAKSSSLGAVSAKVTVSPPQLLRVRQLSSAMHAEREHFLYLPEGYSSLLEKRWPVLLFLHGNGERGDARAELDYVLKNGPLYEAWIQKRKLPFILIVPQLPMYGQDEKADYLKNRRTDEIPVPLLSGVPARPPEFPTPDAMKGATAESLPSSESAYGPPMGWPELEADLIAMLDDVVQKRRGDSSRQYVSGLSYGGFGTWYLASRHANRFAAVVPVVGYGHPDLMPNIAAAKLPVWCFAGGRDDVVQVRYFYAGLNRLQALGHDDFRFTIEADMGHDVWARVYAGDDVYNWMLAHRR